MRHCLACGSGRLITYCDLGAQPLANSYHVGVEQAEYPLAINVCEHCWHSQLTHAVDPDALFKDYAYVSGTTTTLSDYFDGFVQRVVDEFPYRCLSILDIAGNDGTLLSKFATLGHDVLNVDPAENLTATSIANGVPTLCAYWGAETHLALDKQYDAIIAMNVLGHVSNPLAFLTGCRNALADGGKIWIQTSQAFMVPDGQFDTLYHEHHSFFSAISFLTLAARAGLTVQSVSQPAIHGGSYLWCLGVGGWPDPSVDGLLDAEDDAGYYATKTYAAFGGNAKSTATWLYQVVDEYRDAGYACVGYGAAAKGMTMLRYAGVTLDCIADDNDLKVGLLTPGTNIPIVDVSHLADIDEPICCVILAWNFASEIIERIKAVRNRSDDVFCQYFPERIVRQ